MLIATWILAMAAVAGVAYAAWQDSKTRATNDNVAKALQDDAEVNRKLAEHQMAPSLRLMTCSYQANPSPHCVIRLCNTGSGEANNIQTFMWIEQNTNPIRLDTPVSISPFTKDMEFTSDYLLDQHSPPSSLYVKVSYKSTLGTLVTSWWRLIPPEEYEREHPRIGDPNSCWHCALNECPPPSFVSCGHAD